jgi:DNA-binding winged helix-turn-helix (wHTH) protein
MNKTKTTLLSALCVAALLLAAAALWVVDRSGRERTRHHVELSETYTGAFADRASLYLLRGQPADLALLANTASTLLFGNVILYVQVVADGEAVVDVRASAGAALPLPRLDRSPQRHSEVRRLADGTPYADVIQPLLPLPAGSGDTPQGYVRIGTSLDQLQADLLMERLGVAGVAVLIWGALALSAWLSTRWLGTSARRDVVQGGAAPPPPASRGSEVTGVGELTLDDARKSVVVRGQPVELSPKEFDLLKLLCESPGRVYSNDEILERIWSEQRFASAQDVKQYIYFLRRKLEADPKKPRIILTVRGFGYKAAPPAS